MNHTLINRFRITILALCVTAVALVVVIGRRVSSTDWALRGVALAPQMRESWKTDSVIIDDLSFEKHSDGRELLQAEAMRSIACTGKIKLNEMEWRCYLGARDPIFKSKTSNAKKMACVRIDIIRKSSFAPGYKSVANHISCIRNDHFPRRFDCHVSLPKETGRYLIVAHLTEWTAPSWEEPGLSAREIRLRRTAPKPQIDLDALGDRFLFCREIELLPFVSKDSD